MKRVNQSDSLLFSCSLLRYWQLAMYLKGVNPRFAGCATVERRELRSCHHSKVVTVSQPSNASIQRAYASMVAVWDIIYSQTQAETLKIWSK